MSAADLRPQPWPKGHCPNPNGRPKKWLKRIDEMCANADLHPFTELMKLLPELAPKDKAQVWLSILPYVQAKPKEYDEVKEIMDELKKLPTKELIDLVKQHHPEFQKAG